MKIRDRIVELIRVPGSQLIPNAKNWRTHPVAQLDALRGILAEVGYAGAALGRKLPDGSIMLIDGHARVEVSGDTPVPVLILDVTDDEADKLLATFDPLGDMAEADAGKLDALLAGIQTDNAALLETIERTAEAAGCEWAQKEPSTGVDNPADHWDGMPEFEHEDLTPWKSLIVHFKNQDDYDAFAALIEQPLTEKTRSVWHPAAEIGTYADKRYSDEP